MIDLIKTINVPRGVMTFGGFLMVAAAVNESFFGLTIVEGTNVYIGALGAIILIVGFAGWIVTQRNAADLKIADAKLREARLKAGGDPSKDKTIIRDSDD